ncbi:MAG: ABC transporter permease [Hyphomicrobium sp.]
MTALPFPRILALAMRELRSGLSGFYVFIACVALGVMVITAVGALSDALRAGFASQSEAILGGDATFSRMHARAEGRERSWIEAQGRISETASMRTMARRIDGEDQALVEIKAVDAGYPLAGVVSFDGAASVDEAVRRGDGIAADPVLLERLRLKVGDKLKLGELEVDIRATIAAEPDGIVDRLTYGPRVLVSLETLLRTGLVQPGSLIRWRYAVKLNDDAGSSAAALAAFREKAKAALPEAGFTMTDRRDPSPQVTRTLDRLRQFLTLIGLTALLVGGVGVANAVATFIERRRKVIATMKSLGANSRLVFTLFLVQVMVMAAIGILIGLAFGVIVPFALNALFGDALPIKAEISVSGGSIALAVAYGLLVALVFALWPLGRAERVSASVLFRDEVDETVSWPRPRLLVLMAGALGVLVALAIVTSEAKLAALYFCLGLIGVFAIFLGLGEAVTRVVRLLPRPRRPEIAIALGNLGAPGGMTRSVVLSLGAGLSLLVAVALADASLVNELRSRLPTNSPSYFVLDIPKGEYAAFAEAVLGEQPAAKLVDAPMLRGRLVRLKDRSVEEIKVPPEAQWVLTGDRGLTYSDTVPEGSKLVKGAWWEKGYSGEPLVSFEVELAEKLGVAIGDSVTVNVLGRNISARIANLREVKWETLALNFVMVFSPNTLAGAPHNLLATITLPKSTPVADEARLARQLGRQFPSISAIRVKDAIEAFNMVFAKVMIAVRVAGSVTLLAGALVLAGALATAQRRRILEAVILKTLGATRRRILTTHFTEYVLLAAVTAFVALLVGTFAAWVAVREVMDLEFTFSWRAAAEALAMATGLVVLFGSLGTYAVLRARPVPYLRSE